MIFPPFLILDADLTSCRQRTLLLRRQQAAPMGDREGLERA